jgi:SAM-dependent methyltransferase
MTGVRSLAAVAAFVLAPVFAAEEVPYVQTPQPVVDAMLKLAGVNGRDFLIDLGSGDGRIPITAAKRFGTRGYGVDYVGSLVKLANDNAAKAGVADRVRFEERDIFKTDVSAATVVAFYLLPDFNLELRPKLLEELKPGTRLVSHDGDMGDWPPDAKIVVDAPGKTVGVEKKSAIYLWVVPAMVMGEWKTRVPLAGGTREVTLDLAQSFQSLSSAASVRGKNIPLERASWMESQALPATQTAIAEIALERGRASGLSSRGVSTATTTARRRTLAMRSRVRATLRMGLTASTSRLLRAERCDWAKRSSAISSRMRSRTLNNGAIGNLASFG